MRSVELRYPTQEALSADYEQSLRKGRAFVAGLVAVGERESCDLTIIHPTSGTTFTLTAEAVWVGAAGVGFDLTGLDSRRKDELLRFVAGGSEVQGADGPAPEDEAGADVNGAQEGSQDAKSQFGRPQRNMHERVRAMSAREREDLSRRGSLAERVALERAFAASVWEGLLQNPQLTSSEVARIAKNGSLPKPLVQQIVNNASWLASPEIQRALLTNPRCSGPHLERVMKAMKPADLLRLAQHCPYRQEVRGMAQRLTGKRS